MGRGGYRPGAGRKPSEFKLFMRSVASDPEAWEKARERAREDPVFWLKCCEFAHGRPAQAVQLSGSVEVPRQVVLTLPGVADLPPTFAALPGARAPERIEG
jgi:hypothetical protein